MTANGQHLGIRVKCKSCDNYAEGGKNDCKCSKETQDIIFVLPYKLFINHAPGVLVYRTGVGINPKGIFVDGLENTIDKIKESPTKDAQTERMFKSTLFDAFNKSIEPAMFHGNTIDFHYTLHEFFTRLIEPLFFYRIHVSELLFNNLDTFEAEEHYREKEITETVETKKTDHAD
ncbi:3818_t:CDS:2, partial [Funneliformis geosporum]